ncbi:MAG: hypothetical protein FJ296_07680 [Planctomycetes bacterium]|nr:hypothetical protein [Planctomycetota bacterium]
MKLTTLAILLLGAAAAAQTPCGTAVPVQGYRSLPGDDFEDITALPGTVTLLGAGADDATAAVAFPPGFAFRFYGTARTGFTVCSNGWLSFEAAPAPAALNTHAGDTTGPNEAIHAWFDDLALLDSTSSLAWRADLAAQTLTVQWTRVATCTGKAPLSGVGSFSFQAVLFSSTHPAHADAIELRYDHESPGIVPVAPCGSSLASTAAVSATVGVEPAALVAGAMDPTERGAANEAFPSTGLRLLPLVHRVTPYTGTVSVVPMAPLCHRETGEGVVILPEDPCDTPCYGDETATTLLGGFVPLPWKFSFFGRHVKSAALTAGGYVALGEGHSQGDLADGPLGDPSPPNALLAGWGDTLEGVPGAEYQYRVIGEPGCRVFAFEWHDWSDEVAPAGDCGTGDGALTFQVKLFEAGAGEPVQTTGDCPYDDVLPGVGNDTVAFEHEIETPGPFSATIGAESHDGLSAVTVGHTLAAPPLEEARQIVDPCDWGTVRFYGDANANDPSINVPELQTNGVAPLRGNSFGLRMVGCTDGWDTLLYVDLSPLLPGQGIPCPCGGYSGSLGTFWVTPGGPLTLVLPLGPAAPSASGLGSKSIDLVLPTDPVLAGATFFAQMIATFKPLAGKRLVELTEGAKITIG